MKDYVRTLKELNKAETDVAGGKGASLGEMTKFGIPIPPGFVILTSAYENFLEENDLKSAVESLLGSVNHKEVHTVENASESIQTLILGQKIPKDVDETILKHFRSLDSTYVAVRSSATAEDSISYAWAGQLDSFLNTTESYLLENIKKCWASLFSTRAISYRFAKGLNKQEISVAVIVQKMINSEMSGIAFSVHPVTEDKNQLIIEAGFGLGEAVVSGQITPDSYVIKKNPRKIIDINLGAQTKGLFRAKNTGNEWSDVPQEKRGKQVLLPIQILELSDLIVKIEQHYSFPVDIEWAYEKGKFYIVQSRPITTLQRNIYDVEKHKPIAEQKRKKMVQWQKIWSKRYSLRLGENWTYSVATRFRELFDVEFAPQRIIIKDGFGYGYFSKHEHVEALKRIKARILTEGFEEFFENQAQKVFVDFLEYSTAIGRSNLGGKTMSELMEILDAYVQQEDEWMNYVWMVFLLDECLSKTLQEEVKKRYKEKGDDVLAAILQLEQKTAVGQLRLEILDLAKKVQAGLSKKDQETALQKITKKYEYFSILNMDEDVLGKDYFVKELETTIAATSDPASELNSERIKDSKLRKAYKKVLNENRVDKRFINLVIASKKVAYYREYRNDLRQETYFYARKLYKEIARRLNSTIGEIIYLTRDEITDSLSLGKASASSTDIASRKRRSAIILLHQVVSYEFDQKKVDALFSECNQEEQSRGNTTRIQGVVAYKGIASGIVKKINNVSEDASKFNEGDILVATTTNLAFVSLMTKAAAIVTDEGGMLTHTAIVARELKKPAIVGTRIATQVLKDGDRVVVDAIQGIVKKV